MSEQSELSHGNIGQQLGVSMAGSKPNIIRNIEDTNLGNRLSIYSPSPFEEDSGLKQASDYPHIHQNKLDEVMWKDANPTKTPA